MLGLDRRGALGRADRGRGGRDARLAAAVAVVAHCRALIDAAGPACWRSSRSSPASSGWARPAGAALEAVVAHARAAGLLVLADGKRGDIASDRRRLRAACSARPRALGAIPGLGADAATVNPLLGDGRAGAADRRRPTRGSAGCSCSSARPTPARPTCAAPELADGARSGSVARALVDGRGRRPGGESGLSDGRRRDRPHGARGAREGCGS